MSETTLKTMPAELIKADTALRSFRDGGYILADAVGEMVDNSQQSGAKKIHINWEVKETEGTGKGKNKGTKRQVEWFAMADNGSGIPAELLANVLTVGFSTRYGNREGIGRFGVGFKLASISQAKRIEIYSRPAFLKATKTKTTDGREVWTPSEENKDGRIFMTYLDLDEIDSGTQGNYNAVEVDDFPEECVSMMEDNETGTLIVWRNLDRLNHEESFAEKVDEKLSTLAFFLRRAYRLFIANGLEIYLNDSLEPLSPYDPLFEVENSEANKLAAGESMKGELVEAGKVNVNGYDVTWVVQLSPKVTRLYSQGGGVRGPNGPQQFKKLHIPDNEGKISFLRHGREISYTTIPKFLPGTVEDIYRYVGVQISFPPALDEYFQVKHIKRGAEPIEKLRQDLRKAIDKPFRTAIERIRKQWEEIRNETPANPDDTSGGRQGPEEIVKKADDALPVGRAGQTMTPDEEDARLRQAASDIGIVDPVKQEKFVAQAKQQPVVALDVDIEGSGLLVIEHLTNTVVVRINRRHPFVKQIYKPLRDAIAPGAEEMDRHQVISMLGKAADGIDLLFFAYAKAENQSQNPDDDYEMLREDWGKFAKIYVRDRNKVSVS